MSEELKSNVLNGYKQKYLNLLHEIISLEPTDQFDIERFQLFARFDLEEVKKTVQTVRKDEN